MGTGSSIETMSPSLRLQEILSVSTPSGIVETDQDVDGSENDSIEIVQTKMHNKA